MAAVLFVMVSAVVMGTIAVLLGIAVILKVKVAEKGTFSPVREVDMAKTSLDVRTMLKFRDCCRKIVDVN